MDTENTNNEQSETISKEALPSKMRMKERSRSQTTPQETDINDPENLDYEDIDDNHQNKQSNHTMEKSNDENNSHTDIQNHADNGKVESAQEPSPKNDHPEVASDEGELDEADLEDGEIHDPSTSKNKNAAATDEGGEQNRRCHWGPNCKYIHPPSDSVRNSSGGTGDSLSAVNNDISPPTSAGVPLPQIAANSWISPQATAVAPSFFPNPLLRAQAPLIGIPLVQPGGAESAWERGLRSAKTLREQSMRRKQQDKDFNDKKFNLSIRDAVDERDTGDNLPATDRQSPIDYDLPASNYPDQRNYDRYHPYMYAGPSSTSHYNNHSQRMNNNPRHNNPLPVNEHSDRRSRHSDDYNDSRNDTRSRKDKSAKDSKSMPKRDDSSSYRRNSSQQQYASGSHHNHDEQSHLNSYGNRRGDDWHDPWDRSRNHGSSHRRSPGGGRERSYSSSVSSSSSSRSSRSRSKSTSSSSRSRSRSRSRPKRRSPSVTRARRPTPTSKSSELPKNGHEKKTNGNKRPVSPAATTNKFLPGRQISSHTLKKAEKSSNSSHLTSNNHSKDSRAKDSDAKTKKHTKKENISRSDSTSSSSSSSDSDVNHVARRSSSSSSDSSSSESDSRPSTKTKTASGGTKTSTASGGHSTKSNTRSVLSSSTGGSSSNKNTSTKSKVDPAARESTSSSSAKKRRDTSSSTGSTSTTNKKTKLNDSHKSSTDASNAENSDSNKKKEKQKILKKLQEVEKLISQRSTKTSS